ncbi:MAG: hypothetical protein DWQ31_16650 [Planctomycetota bacterium]|nr:MAG: hypothetical protein DWQ31_16650 [Planctomycetota bacterium]
MPRRKKLNGVDSLAQLTGDAANPRKISDEGAAGLAKSLEKFGDLSGIVFNVQTGELVTGHQRVKQIQAKWPEAKIEVVDTDRGVIRIDAERFFAVRVVDWSKAKQRAANVAANNAKIQGKFTSDLSTYLLEVEAELSEELPTVLDDCLLTELMAAGMDLTDATEDEATDEAEDLNEAAIEESYQLVVTCKDEAQQKEMHQRLTKEGFAVRVLTI